MNLAHEMRKETFMGHRSGLPMMNGPMMNMMGGGATTQPAQGKLAAPQNIEANHCEDDP